MVVSDWSTSNLYTCEVAKIKETFPVNIHLSGWQTYSLLCLYSCYHVHKCFSQICEAIKGKEKNAQITGWF